MVYRKEIDGLRALAVIPVIFFHAGFNAFSGGFVGVDIFFVISGYLISSIIIEEQSKGTFSILTFYERRARRILPALFFVILCCLPFAWFFLVPTDLKDFGQSLVAVSLFLSNFLFWIETDYFSTAAEFKPLLHTWSLAIEEQFYLFFPIFLMLFWKSGIKCLVVLITLIALLSFSLALFGGELVCCSPHFFRNITSFYLPFGRIWELMLGSICAFYLRRNSIPISHTTIPSMIGLLSIIFSIIFFDGSTKSPGFYTLVPTIGTALLILCANHNNIVGKLFSLKYLVKLGLISYSVYLWHYVVFAFARHIFLDVSNFLLFNLSLISILFAYFSWRYIEKPFRDRANLSQLQIFSLALFLMLSFVGIGSLIHFNKGFEQRYNLDSKLVATIERPSRDQECFEIDDLHKAKKWGCNIGKKSDRIEFLITGDSHAYSLLDTFDLAAIRAEKTGFFTGTAACPPLLNIFSDVPDKFLHNCYLLNKRIFSFVRSRNIKNVVWSSRWTAYTDGTYDNETDMFHIGLKDNYKKNKETSRDAFSQALAFTITQYNNIGVNIHLIAQAPHQLHGPNVVYYRANSGDTIEFKENLRKFSVSHGKHLELQLFTNDLFNRYSVYDNFYFWNFDDIFCREKCLIGNTQKSFYFDDNHLSIEGAKLIEDHLLEIFKTFDPHST